MNAPSDEYGTIPITPTRAFRWMRNLKDREVAGGLFDEYDRPVPGTYGWWRTQDPQLAAKFCGQINGLLDAQGVAL